MKTALELGMDEDVSHSATLALRSGATAAGRGAAVRAAGLEVRVAKCETEIEALGPAWRALEARATTPVFFQSFAWCRHVVQTLRDWPHCGRLRPFVLTAWRGPDLVAVWPLQLLREAGATVLTDLSSPFGQYADVLIAPDAVPHAVQDAGSDASLDGLIAGLIADARRLSRADALVLRKVRADTPLGQVMARAGHALGAPQQAPFVAMGGHATFEAFHVTTKAKTRKNVRNATHRLEKLGRVSHRVERRSAAMDAALGHCFDLRSDWLERHGLTSTAFAHPAFAAMVQGLADPATHYVDVLSMMLLLDDQPISIHYGFVHNRRYYAYMAARDPRHDACSPGKVHLEHLLKACFELGVETVDLLPPQMAYKQVWATGAADVEDFGVTWTVRGWIAGGLWRGHVRPAAKRLFLALPGGVRQRLVNNHPMPWIGGAGRSPNDNGQIDQCAIGPLVDDKMDAQFGIVVVVE